MFDRVMLTTLLAALLSMCPHSAPPPGVAGLGPDHIYVDGRRGRDGARGTRARAVRSVAAALALLPDPTPASVTIQIAGGAP